MPTALMTRAVCLEIVTEPTLAQHQSWWEDIVIDPIVPQVFTDLMPTTLEAFLAPAERGDVRPTVFLDSDGEILGAFWLHDYGIMQGHAYTWCGTYIRPQYRHGFSAAIGRAMRQVCKRYGYRTIFVACRHSNVAAQRFAERAFRLHRLDVYPQWAPFEGRLDDVVLFTARREDSDLCWRVAAERAHAFQAWMANVHIVSG